MNDLKALSQVVLERAASLAEQRLNEHKPWELLEQGKLSPQEFTEAIYLDGVRDAMAYLEHLLDEEKKA